ncbi:MAG: TetR-like C-terminal domain-containing protein, partial [Mycobacterium sp.]|uniref:TetR-like C-terminal domain-containing protein n=1 Tax=Mycobacterium sp. TaxID=1785 RepID=UPI003CC51782
GDLEALLHDKAATFDGPGGRLLRALTAEAAHNDTLARVLIDAIVAPIGDRVAAVLGRAAQRGEIPAGQDPAIITDLIIGPIISRVFLTRPDTTAVPVAALVDHLVPYLLRAIGAAAPNHN